MDDALATLAADAGALVVQGATTGTLDWLRDRVAGWFGRDGAADEETAARTALDRTGTALARAEADDLARARETGRWEDRFTVFLERLEEPERSRAAQELRTLLTELAAEQDRRAGEATAGDHGTAVTGDVRITAEGGSAAAWRMGDVSIGTPQPRDRDRDQHGPGDE